MALGDFNVGGGASQDVDKTLKVEGAPADAKAVGDALAGKSPTSHTHSNMTAATASTPGQGGHEGQARRDLCRPRRREHRRNICAATALGRRLPTPLTVTPPRARRA